jgi:hypothetical protein
MLDLEPPARHFLDHVAEVRRAAGADDIERGSRSIGVGHLPGECLLLSADDGGRSQSSARNANDASFDERTTLHLFILALNGARIP